MAYRSHLKWLQKFWLFAPKFLEGVGPINGTLSFYKCGFIVGDTISDSGNIFKHYFMQNNLTNEPFCTNRLCQDKKIQVKVLVPQPPG